MKQIAILAALFIISFSTIQAQSSLESFFKKYQDDEAFTIVNISPKMFEMIAKLDVDDDEGVIKTLANSITGLRILAKDEGDGSALYDEATRQITSNNFEELLTVRDKGENIRFLVREGSGDIIEHLVLLVGGLDQFVLLDITGSINLKTIGKLGSAIDVPGAEHLEKLNDN